MRILYVCRLMSGFRRGFAEARWAPEGSPAVYKMIEALDRGEDDVRLIMTEKGNGPDGPVEPDHRRDRVLEVMGLRRPVTVLAGNIRFRAAPARLNGYLNEIRQIWRLWREVRRFRPDLVYLDRANVLAAAVFARSLRPPVVLRLLGVTPGLHRMLEGRRPFERLTRWAYRAPFALVICSQDGSGGERWLEKALRPGVPRVVLLNGVSLGTRPRRPDPRLKALPAKRMVALFLGRLERVKGCDEFIEAIMALRQTHRERIHALVVGDGSRAQAMRERVEDCGAGDMVTFIEALPHDQVVEAFASADVYVSLNRQGNLSNANLEAMKIGVCAVLPDSRPADGIDVATDRLLPPQTVVRLRGGDQVRSLGDALVDLCDHPEERRGRARATAAATRKFIPSWEERIGSEREMLARIAAGDAPLPAGDRAGIERP